MKRRPVAAALACLPWLCAGFALAQSPQFPSRPVTVIVPYAAGGLPDTVARVVGQKLGDKWGQPVVVENRPGGNGVVAAQALASRPADGYTLMITDGTMFSVNQYIYAKLPYDPVKDFTFICLIARAPLFLALAVPLPVPVIAATAFMAGASIEVFSVNCPGTCSFPLPECTRMTSTCRRRYSPEFSRFRTAL